MTSKHMSAEPQAGDYGQAPQGQAGAFASGFAFDGGLGIGLASDAAIAAYPPRGGSAREVERRRLALLARTLESEVIPRLLLSRRDDGLAMDPMDAAAPAPEDIEAMVCLVMAGDLEAASASIGALQGRGIPIERIYLDVLAPVARRLGEMWEADRCDFTTVTVGLCCLQQVVLANSHAFRPRPGRPGDGRRVLLCPVPGEQHSFGLLMVGEFFRRQGWEVASGTGASAREVVALVRKQWFATIGFSMACEEKLDALACLIRDVRRTSRNPRIGVLVGGKAFSDRPELVALVGADATAMDGQQATLKAETLLALLSRDE